MEYLARSTDPETSHTAAERALAFKDTHANRIIQALITHGPMTAHEIAPHVGLDYVAVDRRMARLIELSRAFVARHNGEILKRTTPSGGVARVYVGVA